MNERLTIQDAKILSEAILTIQSDLNLSDKELATILGLSATQFMKRKQSKFLINFRNKNAFNQGVLLVRLYNGLSGMLGDDMHTLRYWLNTTNDYLKNKPALLMTKCNGLDELVNYLESFRPHKFNP